MTGRLLPGTAATKGSMLRSGPSVPICPSSLRCSGESCLTLKHSPDPATPVLVDLERPLRARAGSTRLLGSLPPPPTRARAPAGRIPGCSGGKPRLQALATPPRPANPGPSSSGGNHIFQIQSRCHASRILPSPLP